nr:lipoyl synthase [Deltaproteobacteria bacterium]
MSETRVHLPVVGPGSEPADAAPAPVRRRHPEWIRATLPTKPAYFELRAMVKEL